MTETDSKPICPHCDSKMVPMSIPPEGNYDCTFFFVCFNDKCPYFVKGWQWMWDKYEVKASYRHRINPVTGHEGPLPVWSKDALKDKIL